MSDEDRGTTTEGEPEDLPVPTADAVRGGMSVTSPEPIAKKRPLGATEGHKETIEVMS